MSMMFIKFDVLKQSFGVRFQYICVCKYRVIQFGLEKMNQNKRHL